MRNTSFWKVTLSLVVSALALSAEAQVGTLSEGACWYENKESLRVASFNDKTVYMASKAQIESELVGLLESRAIHAKTSEMDLSLHCGGYGASLVAKIVTEAATFCVWTRFEKGSLVLRSIGSLNDAEANKNSDLCDGRKWGEFILSVTSSEFALELQGPKWASVIKEIQLVSKNLYRVKVVKDYEFRETEVMNMLEENFTGKKAIRFMEFNEYRHPIGEFVSLK
jgi:hypothetical protein